MSLDLSDEHEKNDCSLQFMLRGSIFGNEVNICTGEALLFDVESNLNFESWIGQRSTPPTTGRQKNFF
jgi:hypothetical protein